MPSKDALLLSTPSSWFTNGSLTGSTLSRMSDARPAAVFSRILSLEGSAAFLEFDKEQLEFFRKMTGIEDEDALKTHILAIQREAYAVSRHGCHNSLRTGPLTQESRRTRIRVSCTSILLCTYLGTLTLDSVRPLQSFERR